MPSAILGDRREAVDVNRARTLAAIVYLAVVGPCVFILQPGFVQGLVEYLGFSEQRAGYTASAEILGLAATTVLLSAISHRISWRSFMALCVAVCVSGNLLSIGRTEFVGLATIRFFTGLGSGGMISLTFTMMGLTERSDRNFGYIVTSVLAYGAFGLLAMPAAYDRIGMDGVLIFFALFSLSGIACVRFLPDSGHAASDVVASDYAPIVRRLSLVAILIYNTGIGIVWAYLFLVGLAGGMREQAVANVLTVSQFLGIAGALLAVVFETRLGRLLPLSMGMLGGAASIYVLVGDVSPSQYWLAVCSFNFLWNLSVPYMLAALAEFDASGRTVVHGVSMQFLGYAIGPMIAARLLGIGGYDTVHAAAVVLFAISAVAILPGVLAQTGTRGVIPFPEA